MHTRGITSLPTRYEQQIARLTLYQEGGDSEDHHGHDTGQRCVRAFPRCPQEHSDCRFGPEETRIFIPNVGNRDPFWGIG